MSSHAARALPPVLVALLVVGAHACSGGSDPVAPPPPTPGSLTAVAGAAAQTAVVGGTVAQAPAVRVLSTAGQPMAGVGVAFAVTAGGGSVSNASTRTNADGVASAGSWTLGTTAGANELTATVVGTTLAGRLSATAIAGPAAVVHLVSGDGQTDSTGFALPEPVVVRVTDIHGNPVAGASLDFLVEPGSGSVTPEAAVTGDDGSVSATWTLGPAEVTQRLLVQLRGAEVSRPVTATAVPKPLFAALVDVSPGGLGNFACALRESGAVGCWGMNEVGQLGDGTQSGSSVPSPLRAGGLTFSALALGGYHGCALSSDGAAYCWGSNAYGAIGDGTRATTRLEPVPVSGGHTFTRLSSASTSACGLKSDGSVWCWGTSGGLATTPTRLDDYGFPFTELAVGAFNVCAISSGHGTSCWSSTIGGGRYLLDSPVSFVSLTAGDSFTCGLTADGAAYCWGINWQGQLGDGTGTLIQARATPVAGDLRFTSIDAGEQHACGVATDGSIHCWGSNEVGKLGTGSVGPTRVPFPQKVATPPGVQFRSVAAGRVATCAVATSGAVYCWGAVIESVGGEAAFQVRPTPTPRFDR